jgi:hypothetical protein
MLRSIQFPCRQRDSMCRMPRSFFARYREQKWQKLEIYPVFTRPVGKDDSGLWPFSLLETGGWWARQDSNLQPDGYEPPALTIELHAPRLRTLPRLGRLTRQRTLQYLTGN